MFLKALPLFAGPSCEKFDDHLGVEQSLYDFRSVLIADVVFDGGFEVHPVLSCRLPIAE